MLTYILQLSELFELLSKYDSVSHPGSHGMARNSYWGTRTYIVLENFKIGIDGKSQRMNEEKNDGRSMVLDTQLSVEACGS